MSNYLVLAIVLFVYMNLWFVISLIKKRNDVADVAWGLGFVIMAWTSYFLTEYSGIRGLVVNILISLWGLRLAWHIHSRSKNRTEDYRYLAWRKEWGKWFFLRSYLQIYLLQGVLLYLVVLPVFAVNSSITSSWGWLDFVGLAVWVIGFFFEVVGDAQLTQHISNPANKGKLMLSGLWAYSRHPNYFGEVTLWWGIYLISLGISPPIFTIAGPITITTLILFVSGIPLLEKKYEGRPDFEEYKKRVSIFIPLPPSKK